jgi:hypothetical protein
VFCGHEIQVNESLQNPGTDGIKTGSAYGFANLNAKQSKTYQRQQRGVWHTMEIRMVGQRYTVLVDGDVINQFDNSIPKLASRNGDPPTPQFPQGYLGLQTHGGTDRILYREIRVKDLEATDVPRALRVVGGSRAGQRLTCLPGNWTAPRNVRIDIAWYRANRIGADHPHLHAPSQEDLGSRAEPAEPRYGTQDLPYVGPQRVASGRHYRTSAEDAGKLVYCQVSATAGGATTWKTASAREIR